MTGRNKILWLARVILLVSTAFGSQQLEAAHTNLLEIKSITVMDKTLSLSDRKSIRLPSSPENITFYYGFVTNAHRSPIRLTSKLEGHDTNWAVTGGEMLFMVRFYDENHIIVGKSELEVKGNSDGWRGDLTSSTLTHRKEMFLVPPKADRLVIVISSAGPQSTEGVYIVSDLKVSAYSAEKSIHTILEFPDYQSKQSPSSLETTWMRDGINPGMAKIIDLGQSPPTKALEILDDDRQGHAEWHNILESAPKVTPGDHLVIEWNEMYSIGESGTLHANYPRLSPGKYVFKTRELSLFGTPTGVENAIDVIVPLPFWKTLWFWGIICFMFLGALLAGWRHLIRMKTQRLMMHLEKQRLVEQERLRIARDIHDDLGARGTQITLASAMALGNASDLNQIRSNLEQISQLSRDLVTALDETVWTVNPENDNLNALGNYIFQIANDLCERGQCCCRFHAETLSEEVIVESQIRHNLCMVVKEAANNVIKHAAATEINLQMTYDGSVLTLCIKDNGKGFTPDEIRPGNGLTNIKQRLENIGGSHKIQSRPGDGTTIWIYLTIEPRKIG